MEARDIAWLAGLLEGEGCFSHRGNCPTVQLYMSDEDIVRRAATLVGTTHIGSKQGKLQHHKVCFYWTVSGPRAVGVMETILPLMGVRRQARIKELLAIFKVAKKQSPSTLVCPHTELYRKGRTVCNKCYQHDWYVRRREVGDAL